MDELLPCPFCGGKAEMMSPGPNRYYVICGDPDCTCTGPWDLGESGAAEKWNKRRPEDDITRLRAALEEIANYDTGSYQSQRANRALKGGE